MGHLVKGDSTDNISQSWNVSGYSPSSFTFFWAYLKKVRGVSFFLLFIYILGFFSLKKIRCFPLLGWLIFYPKLFKGAK